MTGKNFIIPSLLVIVSICLVFILNKTDSALCYSKQYTAVPTGDISQTACSGFYILDNINFTKIGNKTNISFVGTPHIDWVFSVILTLFFSSMIWLTYLTYSRIKSYGKTNTHRHNRLKKYFYKNILLIEILVISVLTLLAIIGFLSQQLVILITALGLIIQLIEEHREKR